nr:Si:dkey-25e12.3 [Danio rerio]
MCDNSCFCENKQDTIDESLDKTCIFCTIAKGDDRYTEILAEDEDFVCFRDINPGAPHHYLVIPKKHIYSCLSLYADDISLVRAMAEMGRNVLKANNVTDLKDISLGFHVPPYITVPHLHLYVLAPYSQLYKWAINKFRTNWYINEEKTVEILMKGKTQMV